VGEAGDSLLVEFGAASEAVACAVEVQEKLARLNADLPEDRRMRFRIGINLGEVIADAGTIHGDGVNVAARLEKLAEPGGIVVAGSVHQQVKGKAPWPFEDLGERTLHNIAEPVRAFRIALKATSPAADRATTIRDPGVTVAVLPFTNMSGDPEQEYFSDGVTEDLITALAKFRYFSVLARNTTFALKGQSPDVQAVGRKLGARYVVEGSVRKGGNRVRVTAQLIDSETGAHIWAERFDRDLADIFAVQDEIVAAIAAQLSFSLIDARASDEHGASNTTSSANDYFLKGRAAWRRGDAIATRDQYLKAVEIDPNHALGLAALAFLYSEDCSMQLFGLSIAEEQRSARDYAERALHASKGDPTMHHMLGTAFLNLGELDKAKHHLVLANSLNPHFIYSAMNLGLTMVLMGEQSEGLAMIERAFKLEPRIAPAMQAVPFYAHYTVRDFEAAITDFNLFDNPFAYMFLILAAAHAHLGHDEEARAAVAAFGARKPPDYDVRGFATVISSMCRRPEDRETWLEGFRKAGLPV
jgi:TolB-like protein